MNRFSANVVFALLPIVFLWGQSVRTHDAPGLGDYDAPFNEGGTYRDDVQSPDGFLEFKLGARPATHEEVIAYFEYLDDRFPNAILYDYGKTFEGRRLVYLVVTSESNAGRLESIRNGMSKIADPRKLRKDKEATAIIEASPTVAWMGYGIHGDELSSTDAALQVAYQLLAGTDNVSERIRNKVVVCIDPIQNPDGRMRFLSQLQQFSSVVPSTDVQSFHHRGVWPWGRGNHYLFDLNRDWFLLVHPETRGRIKAVLDWHPQFVLDCHEMGPFDTYLFSPPRAPFNPYLPKESKKWWGILSQDQAAAFDKYGWSYYTREWNEELYPGYGSSWPMYGGAIGVLYEQAGVDGSQMKRPDGTIMTYRETVHHQFISSMANLTTVARHRKELLNDYYKHRVSAVGERERSRSAAFLFPPGSNSSRVEGLMKTLLHQEIEVETAVEDFKVRNAVDRNGVKREISFSKGTAVVRLNQPSRNLIEAILTFDIRFDNDFLRTQRKSQLKYGKTKVYDATGWSLALGYDVNVFYSEVVPTVKTMPYESAEKQGGIVGKSPKVGYVFSGSDDRAYSALGKLLDMGVKVWSSREPFSVDGRSYPRGSFLIRVNANPDVLERDIVAVAKETDIVIHGVNGGLVTSGPDLGGNEFQLLERPRIVIVGGNPVSAYGFGTAWHLLDAKLNLPVSTLDASRLTGADLDKYNVLILPDSRGGPKSYKRLLSEGGVEKLKGWMEEGGTLIAIGSAAAFAADSSSGLSKVRQRRQVLNKLSKYDADLDASKEAEEPTIDSLAVWEGKKPEEEASEKTAPSDPPVLKQADELARKLSPQGTILKVDLDEEHWLSFGAGADVPIMYRTSYAYMANNGVEVSGRLARYENIRLSGLLWPEARERWSETIYASRESVGKGQIILFATQPDFRGYFHGGERLFLNAVLLGPGFGARQTVEF